MMPTNQFSACWEQRAVQEGEGGREGGEREGGGREGGEREGGGREGGREEGEREGGGREGGREGGRRGKEVLVDILFYEPSL